MTVYMRANADEAPHENEFDHLMRITARTMSQTIIEYLHLKKEGKLFSVSGDKYLDALGEAVRYWDGCSWVPYQAFVQSSDFVLR